MTFDELTQKVLQIWGEIVQKHDYDEYQVKDFLRSYQYGLPETERVQYIEHEGGGEGGGEYCESVIKIDGIFYQVQYGYMSYDGFQWGDAEVTEVVPKEKLVTVYEPV